MIVYCQQKCPQHIVDLFHIVAYGQTEIQSSEVSAFSRPCHFVENEMSFDRAVRLKYSNHSTKILLIILPLAHVRSPSDLHDILPVVAGSSRSEWNTNFLTVKYWLKTHKEKISRTCISAQRMSHSQPHQIIEADLIVLLRNLWRVHFGIA